MEGRKSIAEIQTLNRKVLNNPVLRTILEYAPVFVGVLTIQRQFVLVNEQFFSSIGFTDAGSGMGLRPGEIFGCIHHHDVPSGCGDGPACRYCDVVRLVFAAIHTGEPQAGEARLSTQKNGDLAAWDLMINVEPVEVEGEQLFILFMRDISAEKEKAMVERIFFHDVLNSAASLESLVNLLHPDEDEDDPEGLIRLFRSRVTDIVEQINYHKQLLRAEKGDVTLNPELVDISVELEDIVADEVQRIELNGIGVGLSLSGTGGTIETDRVLLRRILINMIKNAREASSRGDHIDVAMAVLDDGAVQVDVHNPAVMPPEVRSQVFQRSFSTKGAGRGLGTWSMKLLSTRYLGGDITFRSDPGEGTTFTLRLPFRVAQQQGMQ